MPLADYHAHEAVFVRNEGTAVVRALSTSAKDTLRYAEMVSVLHGFTPLAPLHGTQLAAKSWYQVVVTDWSLMVLSQNGGSKASVLLEVPLLSIKDMDVLHKDSGEFLDERPAQQRKTAVISIYPHVATHKLPPAMQDKLRRVQRVLAAGGEPPAAYAAAAGPGCCKGEDSTQVVAPSTPPRQAPIQQQQYSPQQYMPPPQQPYKAYEAQQAWNQQQPHYMQQGHMLPQQYAMQQQQQQNMQQQLAYASQQYGLQRGPRPLGESIEGPYTAPPLQTQHFNGQQQAHTQWPQQIGSQAYSFAQPQGSQQHPAAYMQQPHTPGFAPQSMQPPQQQWAWQQQPVPYQPPYSAAPPTGASPPSPARRTRAAQLSEPHTPSQPPFSPYAYSPASPGGYPLTPPATTTMRLPPPPPLDLRAPVLTPVQQPEAGDVWEAEGAEMEAADYVLDDYSLVLMSMEPRSLLWFHLRRAWLGAHMRYSAVAAGRAGTPLWYAPPNLLVPQPAGSPGPQLVPIKDMAPRAGTTALLERLGYTRQGRVVLQGLYPWNEIRGPGDTANCSSSGRLAGSSQEHTTFTITAAGQLAATPRGLAAHQQYQLYGLPQQLFQQTSVPQVQYGLSPQQYNLMKQQAQWDAEAVQSLVGRSMAEPSEREVREVFQAAEARLSEGCSLFDDDDVSVLQALVLEMCAANTRKARAYARSFFASRKVAAFCLARVYAWGTVCALWAPSKQREARPNPQPVAPDPMLGHAAVPDAGAVPAYLAAYARERFAGFAGIRPTPMGGGGAAASMDYGGQPPATPPASTMPPSSSSSSSSSSRLTPYVAWVLSKGQKGRGGEWGVETPMPPAAAIGTPVSPWTAVLHAAARATATPSPWGPPTACGPRGGVSGDTVPSYGPPSPARANRYYAAASEILAGVPSSRTGAATRPLGPPPAAPAPHADRGAAGQVAQEQVSKQHLSVGEDAEQDPANTTQASGRSLYSLLSVMVPHGDDMLAGVATGRHPYYGTLQGYEALSILDPRHPLAPPSVRGLPPRHRLPLMDPDKLTGSCKTSDEEAYELYLSLYNARCWAGWGGAGAGTGTGVWDGIAGGGQVPAHARRLLRRLGLDPSESTSINDTLATIMDVVEVKSRPSDPRANFCGRSKPPAVPAPPTLAPEPLCLSPLAEGPYLFVQGGLPEGLTLGKGAGRGQGMIRGAAAVDADVAGAGAKALARAQARAQTRGTGSALSAMYLEDYSGASGAGSGPTPGTKLWERLVGRLCAARAWRKAMALAHTLSLLLEQSEGVVGRDGWLGEEVVEAQPEAGDEEEGEGQGRGNSSDQGVTGRGVWTFNRATRHLVAALVQLRDPWGDTTHRTVSAWTPAPEAGAGSLTTAWIPTSNATSNQGPWPQPGAAHSSGQASAAGTAAGRATAHTAPGHVLGTGAPGDPLWWAAQEGRAGRAGAAPLDAIAGVCWGVWQLGVQASSRGGSHSGNAGIVVETLKQVPKHIVHAFLRRLLCRATCMLAAGPDAQCGGQEADAYALRACELLMSLLNSLPSAADAVHDALARHLVHTLRTPSVRAALAARSQGRALHVHGDHPGHAHHATADPGSSVLPGLAVGMYSHVVQEVLGAQLGSRPSSMWTSDLSQATVQSMTSTAHYKMPGALT